MIVALASFALVLLSAPAVANRFTRRVHPRDWTRWSFAALIVGALAAEAALILFSLPTVLRALGAHALVAACARMTGSLMPGGPVVGWSALSVATLRRVGSCPRTPTGSAIATHPFRLRRRCRHRTDR